MSEEENKSQSIQNERETEQVNQQPASAASPSHQTIIQPQKSKNKMDRLLFRPSMNTPQVDTNSQQIRPIVPVSPSLIASQKTKTPRGNNKNNPIINTSVAPLIQTARNQPYNKNSKIDFNNADNGGSEDEDKDVAPDEFDRRNMTKLRRSVEDTVQALINQEAERKTDPKSTDDDNNNDDLNDDILSDHDDNETNNNANDNNNNNNNNSNNSNNSDNNNNDHTQDNVEKSGTSGQLDNLSDHNPNEEIKFPNDFESSTKINNNENEMEPELINANKEENEGKQADISENTNNNQNEDEINNSNIDKSSPVDIDKNFLITQVDEAVEGQDTPKPATNEPEETAEQYQKEGIDISDKDMTLVPKLDLTNNDNNDEIPTDSQSKTKKSKQEPLFTENDVEAAFAEFQNSRTVPPPYMRDATVMYVHAITNEAIEDEDYDLAEKLDKDLKDLIAAFNKVYGVNNANIPSQKDISTSNLQSRLDEVKKQKIIAESEWEEKIKQLKESEQLKIEEIEARQQREREEFEERCQTQEFLQKFTKPSAKLLQLWKLQKGLALQHDFEGAKAIKARAEKLQKQETDEAQQRAIASVKVNYEKLVVKQQRELECAVANGKRKISQMEIEMKKDLENRDKLSKQVETRIKEYRQPLKKSRLPPLNSSQIQSALNQIQIQPLNSTQNSSNTNGNQNDSALNSSSAQRDATTSALSKRAVASRAKKKRVGNPVEQTTVLDVKIANIRSVLGDKSRNKK